MSAGASKKVIIISLIANFCIAIAKLIGGFFTGSAALLAEAVHSFSDCGNQLLLLYGQKAAQKEISEKYPLGRGKELFFWSFIVALLLFSMGGMFSLYEGIHKITEEGSINSPMVGIAILSLAILLEGYAFFSCLKEILASNKYPTIREWIKKTTTVDLLVIFLEDFAAILGLIIALVSLLLAWYTGNVFWDGFGSCLIGVLLISVAIILACKVKPLLIGQSPYLDYHVEMDRILSEVIPDAKIIRHVAILQGVDRVLVAYKIHPGNEKRDTVDSIKLVNIFEKKVKEHFPEIKWQFAELDFEE